MKQSGGHATIYSEVGHGTTFNLYFPQADEAGAISTNDSRKSKDRPPTREIILVVEDDERVRQLTLKRLKLIGYQVLEAENGPSAVEILKNEESIDLVLTDLIIPGGMSGHEVASRAQQLKPGIKVLLTSGYAEELVHGARRDTVGFRQIKCWYPTSPTAFSSKAGNITVLAKNQVFPILRHLVDPCADNACLDI